MILLCYAGGQDNKVEHNLLLQQISTVDENGQMVVKGTKVSRGYYADNGPPTTLSGTGKDVSLSYQGFAAMDNVQFVNGNQLGTRMLLQVTCGGECGGWLGRAALYCVAGRIVYCRRWQQWLRWFVKAACILGLAACTR
jgi:hypothetical protein